MVTSNKNSDYSDTLNDKFENSVSRKRIQLLNAQTSATIPEENLGAGDEAAGNNNSYNQVLI